MSFERFTEWYPRYRQFASEPIYQELYNFLASPPSIWVMAQSSEAGKPALSGIVKELENEFKDRFDFDNPMNRRMIGSMIKEIIHDFGFRRKGQRLVSNSNYFSTASYYHLEKEKASKTISGLFEVQRKDSAQSGNKSQVTLDEQINDKQDVSNIISPEERAQTRINTDWQINELLGELKDAIISHEVDEQEKQETLVNMISIGIIILDSLSALLKNSDNKWCFDASITTPSEKMDISSLSQKLQKEGKIEVNKEVLIQVLDGVLEEMKITEDIKIEKTTLGYKATLNYKGDKG